MIKWLKRKQKAYILEVCEDKLGRYFLRLSVDGCSKEKRTLRSGFFNTRDEVDELVNIIHKEPGIIFEKWYVIDTTKEKKL